MKLESYWYQPSLNWLTLGLLPLSWLFKNIVIIRRWLYRKNIKKSFRFAKPIIVVGNITPGGTGKTPFVIWLANFLKENGFKPGIVSRGVGGTKNKTPKIVKADDSPMFVGDEALLIAKRTQCPLVVGINRVSAVATLLSHFQCDVIISDDGLQHYRLERDIEIAMLDKFRQLGNARLIPAGPLREPIQRLDQVDFIVNHPSSKFTMDLQGCELVSLINPNHKKSFFDFRGKHVHAIAGIGNPNSFFKELENAGLIIHPHIFPDHYLYKAKDLNFNDDLPIIMTEKDSVKMLDFANKNFWFLHKDAKVDDDLKLLLLKKIQEKVYAYN